MDVLLFAKFFSVFVFVIALMLTLSWALKKAGLGGPVLRGADKKRLRVVEAAPIDHKRRMVLIRRDDKEHLIILGPEGETVVETGIQAVVDDETVVKFARDPRNVKV